ncbi:MAG: Lin0512 family protein [Desulfobacterales bacterium]
MKGGMMTQGLCVPQFAPECDQIVVVNAAVTVSIGT